jgi:hypothetical protein
VSLLLSLSLTLFRAEPMAPAPQFPKPIFPSFYSFPAQSRGSHAATLFPPWALPLLLLFSSAPRQLATAPLAAACPHRCRVALNGAARAPWCSPELLLALWYKAAPSVPRCPVSRTIFLLSSGSHTGLLLNEATVHGTELSSPDHRSKPKCRRSCRLVFGFASSERAPIADASSSSSAWRCEQPDLLPSSRAAASSRAVRSPLCRLPPGRPPAPVISTCPRASPCAVAVPTSGVDSRTPFPPFLSAPPAETPSPGKQRA